MRRQAVGGRQLVVGVLLSRLVAVRVCCLVGKVPRARSKQMVELQLWWLL